MPNENARSESNDETATTDDTALDPAVEKITGLVGDVQIADEPTGDDVELDTALEDDEPVVDADVALDAEADVEDAPADDAEDEAADDAVAEDDDLDDELAPVAPKSASGATKRAAKAERKAAERARIEKSKQLAAKARGKSRGGREADTASMTKEQLRHSQPKTQQLDDLNPVWFKPIMFGFLLIGFVWILVYYLSTARLPIAELGDWNLLIGIGIAMVGFLMMTNWK